MIGPNFDLPYRKKLRRMEGQNFSVIHKSQIPKSATVLPAVWQLKRKKRYQIWYYQNVQSASKHVRLPYDIGNPLRSLLYTSYILELYQNTTNHDSSSWLAHKTTRLCCSILTSTSGKRGIHEHTQRGRFTKQILM